jgi:cytochrome c-type biogenesis protein
VTSSATGVAGVGVFAAIAAGAVSVLGVSPSELSTVGVRRVLVPSLLFIASFSVIFILLGLGATAIGAALIENKVTLDRVAAGLIVALGVLFVLAALMPVFGREWHVERLIARAGRGGPVAAGAALSIAWTPCSGPTLGAILAAAGTTRSEGHGAILLAFYSAGLAIPFIATALAFDRMTRLFGWVKRHYGVIVFTGGAVLIAMGVLIWTGELSVLNSQAQSGLHSLGINFIGL